MCSGEFSFTSCPLVLEALGMLATQANPDMIQTLVDVYDKDGTLMQRSEGMSHDEILQVLDSQIRVVADDIYFVDEGVTYAEGQTIHDLNNYTSILVANTSFTILSLATGGRMTVGRLWRVLARQWSIYYGPGALSNIDYYGEIQDCRFELPEVTPGFSIDTHAAVVKIKELECLGNVELIRQAIVWEGKFWVWMEPDHFPPGETSDDHLTIPTVFNLRASVHVLSKMEELPIEILVHITSYCYPLSSLLCLLLTSHYIRSKALAHSSDRDALARAWIQESAPWYIPQDQPNEGKKEIERVGWAYLVRCVESPSMRNRKRIWGIAQQLEGMADAMGI